MPPPDGVPALRAADRRRPPRDLQRRIRPRLARELQLDLLGMVAVDMAVAAGPDEVADAEVALLRQHVGEQGVARDVERHAEEDVAAALVELAAELAVDDVELEQRVAGHQRHLRQLADVPGTDHQTTRIGIAADLVDQPTVPSHFDLKYCRHVDY